MEDNFNIARDIDDLIKVVHFQPLSSEQVITYLKEAPSYQESWLTYLDNSSGLAILAQNPLYLRWIQEYLSENTSPFVVNKIYEWIFQRWFCYQYQQLENMEHFKIDRSNFIECCWIYARAVALKLKETGEDCIGFSNGVFADEQITMQWGRFFRSDRLTRFVAQCCPWMVRDNSQFTLYHFSVVDYFASLTKYDLKNYLHLPFIRGDEGLEHLSQLLDRTVLSTDGNQLKHLVADILLEDISQECYFRLISLSTKSRQYAQIAANAITILSMAKVSFSGLDLSDICIPYADLSGAILDSVHLKNADLSNVNFRGAWVCNSNLTNATMSDIQLAWPAKILPKIQNGNGSFCCYSRDGRRLLVHNGAAISLYSMENLQLIRHFVGHKDSVQCAIFVGDGRFIASGGADKEIRLWNVETGRCDRYFRGHHEAILCMDYHPHEAILATSGNDKIIYFWNLTSKSAKPLTAGVDEAVSALKFSPCGNYIAFGGMHNRVRLCEVSSGDLVRKFDGHTAQIWSIAFSPDQKYLVSASADKTARLWDVESSLCLYVFNLDNDVTSVIFNKKGDVIAGGCRDGTIHLWSASNGKSIFILEGEQEKVWSIDFSPDDKYLITAGSQGIVCQWSIPTVTQPNISRNIHKHVITAVASCAVNQIICSGDDAGIVSLRNIINGRVRSILTEHSDRVTCITFSADGLYVASGSRDGTINISQLSKTFEVNLLFSIGKKHTREDKGWVIENVVELHHDHEIVCMAFSADNQLFLCGYYGKSIVEIWETSTRKLLSTFKIENEERGLSDYGLKHLSFDENSHVIEDPVAIATGKHKKSTNYVKICQNNEMLIAVMLTDSWRVRINFWHIKSGCLQNTININVDAGEQSYLVMFNENLTRIITPQITSISLSPDASFLAIGGDMSGAAVYLYELNSARLIHQYHWPKQEAEKIYGDSCLQISADGKFIALSSNYHICIWSIESETLVSVLKTNHGINKFSWEMINDYNFFIVSTNNQSIKCWRATKDFQQMMLVWASSQDKLNFSQTDITQAKGLDKKTYELLARRGAVGSPTFFAQVSSGTRENSKKLSDNTVVPAGENKRQEDGCKLF